MGRAFEYRKASKLARWDKMAKTFSKIGKDIALAVKAGGPDPDSNPALRRCIQNAKGANMPKDNVERAIKKASGADAENYEEVTYDAKNSPYKNIKGFSVLAVEFCGLDEDENTIADYLNFRWVSHNPTLIQKSTNLYGSGADSSEYKFQYEYKNNFPIKTKLNINNQTVITMVYEYNK